MAALSVVHRTSSSDIRQDRLNPIDDNGSQRSRSEDEALDQQSADGGQPSESDDDGQESEAGSCAKRGTSGEESSTAADDQDARASRAVDSVHQLGQTSTRASAGERVATTSATAGRSAESAASAVQRPLPRAVRTRASSAATKNRGFPTQGRSQSSPRVPLLKLPAPTKETVRPSPSRRQEHGFAICEGRSAARANTRSDPATSAAITIDPGSEPDYDERTLIRTHGLGCKEKVRSLWLTSLLRDPTRSTR